LSAEDYRIIMLEKARQIKAMLDAYGYPMTWYMDTGTFFPLVLEQQGLPGEAWRGLWPEMENLLRELGAAGHDVSYHTHTMFNQDLSRHPETENWNALRYDPVTQKFCSNPDYRGQTIENPCSRNPERYHLLFPNGHAGAIDEIGTKSWWLYQHNR